MSVSSSTSIQIKRKQTYGCCSKVFCFRCFSCCQADDESLLTSGNRRQVSQKLISKYQRNEAIDSHGHISTLDVLIMLYTSEDKSVVLPFLRKCRINPSFDVETILRNDLEYYVPQLINYLVFQEEMNNEGLSEFILQACTADFYFAHLVHFSIYSVSAVVQKTGTVEFAKVKEYLSNLIGQMGDHYQQQLLIASSLFLPNHQQNTKQTDNKDVQLKIEIIEKYGTNFFDISDLKVKIYPSDIPIKNYVSIFQEQNVPITIPNQQQDNYWSCIKFWEDLFQISEQLKFANPKIISLRADLCKINQNLPAAVYIPFVNEQIRNYVVLTIIASETRVFSTKERAPFYICLEIYRPEEGEDLKELGRALERSISPISAILTNEDHNKESPQPTNQVIGTNNIQLGNLREQNKYQGQGAQIHEASETSSIDSVGLSKFYEVPEVAKQQLVISEVEMKPSTYSSQFEERKHQNSPNQNDERDRAVSYTVDGEYPLSRLSHKSMAIISKIDKARLEKDLFGEDSRDQADRLRKLSPFGNFQSWRLVHLIVKTGDNLKQEQFALQLISQFNQIFSSEGLPLILTPYETVSLGPSSGIIEMVRDATTIDSLKRKFREEYKEIGTIGNFFTIYFGKDIKTAQRNFCHSLAAYCLVCYFLQIKDRHNGNILLHKTGKMLHIDFGFFLSIAPGKGLEFEKNVPFKLLSEYIEVLGGVKSTMFNHFRKLFFKGFQAAQKHQDQILLLVKMMYSGHGYTLPCFEKGEQAIHDLEARFNPLLNNDGELYVHTQQQNNPLNRRLINQSLDNWRARWYDKFQYYFQGIIY